MQPLREQDIDAIVERARPEAQKLRRVRRRPNIRRSSLSFPPSCCRCFWRWWTRPSSPPRCRRSPLRPAQLSARRGSWSSYLIASTIAAPIYGRLGDAFGRRRLMFAALASSLRRRYCCAASPTIELLTLARVLQGLGGGGLMTLSQALVGEAIPPRERARYQGYLAAVAVCANTFGPVAGGYLTEHFGWQSIFLVNVPIGLGAVCADPRPANRSRRSGFAWRADPGGLVLFTMFVATTLLSLEQVQHVRSRACCRSAAACSRRALIALVLLVRHENRAPSPLIPLGLLRAAGDLAQRRARRLSRRRAGVADHLPAGLSAGGARGFAVGNRPPAGAAHHRHRRRLAGDRTAGQQDRTARRSFPSSASRLVTANFVVLALLGAALGDRAFAGMLLLNGLFMGTVMGVVQVSVQSRRRAPCGLARRPPRCSSRARSARPSAPRWWRPCCSPFSRCAIRKPRACSPAWSSTRARVRAAGRAAARHSGRYPRGVPRRLSDHGGVFDRRAFSSR